MTAQEQYPHLFNEIESINRICGYVGSLDALEHIQLYYEDAYRGTQCGREFRAFVRSMRALFAPAEGLE